MTTILNLGCGTKVSSSPAVVNVDWSPYVRIARNPVLRRIAEMALDDARAERLRQLPGNILAHDLRKGIPWPDDSVDAVYHSHLLEHIDRQDAPVFLCEVRRVLRPGGIHRIVVPDLETLCREIIDDLETGDRGPSPVSHDTRVAALLEQSVRRAAHGTSKQRWPRRVAENLVLGDARKRGETHQWLYDALNLRELLEESGFSEATVVRYDLSGIEQWLSYGLDTNEDGSQYKPGSLYMEARVPA